MVLFLLNSALMSSIAMTMLKMLGELVASDSAKDHIFMMIIMLCLLLTSAPLQIHLLNMSMKFYDQLEIVPIY